MPVQTKTFRIFVSSTFSDMRVERGILQRDVFNRLDELCTKAGAQFQAVDLRWGVNEESQLDQRTMDICLGEIARCQKMSPRPNFLVLLGDRYGWQPLPARIPVTEMEQIESRLEGEDLKLLQKWYQRDDNAVPPEHLLQPRKDEHKEFKDWQPVEDRLRALLRQAVDALAFSENDRVKYFASATHQEILHGALGSHLEGAKDHVTAFVRQIKGLPQDEAAKDFLDLVDGKVDPYAQSQLGALRGKLKEFLGDACHDYRATWDSGAVALDDEKAFAKAVYSHFAAIIEKELAEFQSPSEVDHERKLQKEFRTRLTTGFQGREKELAQIENYLESPNGKIHALVGASGSGKSSVMAQAILQANKVHERVVYRFLGTSSRSSTVEGLVTSLCAEICERYGTTPEDLFSKDVPDDQRSERLKLMQTDSGLKDLFTQCVGLANPEKPLVLFLDALDQLEDPQRVLSLLSRVQTLPLSVAFVISCLPELEPKLHYAQVQPLPVLERAAGEVILAGWLREADRKLTKDQEKSVLDAFKVEGLPIFLKLAFELSRRWASYSPVEGLPSSVSEILGEFFEALESSHTEVTVRKALGYMLCGRHGGLTEREITTMLVRDEEHWSAFLERTHETHREEVKEIGKLPDVVWSRLYLDLEPYLTERSVAGVPVLCFFHRQFWEEARKGFVEKEERGLSLHQGLGKLFLEQKPFLDSERARAIPNTRKCIEVPFQLMKGAMWTELAETLCDIFFVEAVAKAGMLDGLQGDYEYVLKAMPNGEDRNCIDDFHSLFMRQKHVLGQYPEIVFQHLYNELQWKKGSLREGAKAARNVFMQAGGKFLHQYREPIIGTSKLIATLSGHTKTITSCTFSPDCSQIASSSCDHSIKIWDTKLNQMTMTLVGHAEGVNSCSYSPDGSLIVSGSDDKSLIVWNAKTGKIVKTLADHLDKVTSCLFSSDGLRVISSSEDQTIQIWDIKKGKVLKVLAGHTGKVNACAISPDGLFILSGSDDHTLRIWGANWGKKIKTLDGHHMRINSCAFSLDGLQIVSSDDYTLKLWNATTGKVIRSIESQNGIIVSCVFSPDGSRVLSGSTDGSIMIWSSMTGELISTLSICGEAIRSCAYSRDGLRIVTADDSQTLKIWGDDACREMLDFSAHEQWVTSCAFSPDDSQILSVSSDCTLKLWNGVTGKEIRKIFGHKCAINSCAYSPDGSRIASGSSDCTLKIWDTATGREIYTIAALGGWVTSCAFHPNASIVLLGCFDGTLILWDTLTGNEIWKFVGRHNAVLSCNFSPDGLLIISGHYDGTLRLWDSKTGQEVLTLTGHCQHVISCEFSPDGLRFATASHDNTLRIWDLKTGLEIINISDANGIASCAYSPDGSRILYGRYDSLVIIDAHNGNQEAVLPCQDPPTTCCFSSNGMMIACGDRSGGLQLFRLEGFYISAPIVTGSNSVIQRAFFATCPYCGTQSPLPASVLGAIVSLQRNFHTQVNAYPFSKLPPESWSDPCLFSVCPYCQMPLRFNPFVVECQIGAPNNVASNQIERPASTTLCSQFRNPTTILDLFQSAIYPYCNGEINASVAWDTLANYATALLLLGRVPEARDILAKIHEPNAYVARLRQSVTEWEKTQTIGAKLGRLFGGKPAQPYQFPSDLEPGVEA